MIRNLLTTYRPMVPSSLGGRVMSMLGISLVSTLVLFSLSVFYFVNRTEGEAWQGRQTEAARNAAGTVAGFIQRVGDAMLVVSIVEPDHLVADSDELNTLIQKNPALLEIIRTDSSGRIFASASRDKSVLTNLITIPQSQWFLQAREGHTFLGDVQLSANNEPYLIMAVPSADKGVVAARVEMNVLWEVVKNIHFGKSGEVIVITYTGNIIAHTNPEFVISRQSLLGRPELSAMLSAPNHEWSGSYTDFHNQQVVAATQPVPGTEWIVITELPQSEAFASSRNAIIVLGLEAFLLMLVASLVMVRYVRLLIVSPISQLRDGADRIGQGDLNHRIGMIRNDEVGQLSSAFDMMADNLQQHQMRVESQTTALKMNEARYRAIVEDQTELICRFLPDGTLTFVNEAYCRYFNKRREDLIGHSFIPLIPDEDRLRVEAQFAALSAANPVVSYEHRVIIPDGSLRWQHWTDRAVLSDQSQITEFASVGRDITEQRQAEEELRRLNMELEDRVRERTEALSRSNESLLNEVNERKAAEQQVRASLQEKEVLLKEIHHRVKNNLQIISSLLNLQSNHVKDTGTLRILRDSQSRVRSMALIHEKLYQSKNLAKIEFGEYVQSLSKDLFRSYQRTIGDIQLKIQVDEILLDLDYAVPCGLILNELMTNALKYAFPNGRNGSILVELRASPDHTISLKVTDDGLGLPVDLDISKSQTLGLQLVNSLVKQIDGKLEIENFAGTAICVSFKY